MRNKFLLFLALSCIGLNCHAALYRPTTAEDFDRIIGPSPIAVVNVVDYNPDQPRSADVADMQKVFKDLSDDAPYDKADIAFISVNLFVTPELRTSIRGLQDAIQDADTIVMLFRQGAVLTDRNQAVYKSGVLSKQELSHFIYTHFRNEIDSMIRQQQPAKKPIAIRQPVQPVVQPQVIYQEPPVIVQEPVIVRTGGYYPGRRWRRRGWGGPWGGINIGFGGGRGWGRGRRFRGRGGFGPGRGFGGGGINIGFGGMGRGGMGRGGMRGGGRGRMGRGGGGRGGMGRGGGGGGRRR